MKYLAVTTFALSATALLSSCGGDGNTPGSDSTGRNADPISITTVSGAQHVLTGKHATACYDTPNGRIDTLTFTGTEWTNESFIYAGDDTCSGTPNWSGKIIAKASKGADMQISGWKGQGDVAPQRADGTGSLGNNETVTSLNIEVIDVIDQYGIFGSVSSGFKATLFYVFDDTAGENAYRMYRDQDGAFASASDPYVASSGSGGTTQLPQFLPVAAVSGNDYQLGITAWKNDCYINGTVGDSRDVIAFDSTIDNGENNVYSSFSMRFIQEMYDSNDGSCDPATKNLSNQDIETNGNVYLDGTTETITGWVDDAGNTVSPPQKQDGSGALSNSETYSNMTFIVGYSTIPGVTQGTSFPLTYIVDDSASPAVLYEVDAGVGKANSVHYLQ